VKFEDLNRLKYLDMCQKESLRLQPPARVIVKTAKQEGFLGKFRIHKSMLFLIPFQTLGRSEKIWGPDAELFVPERWQKPLPHQCGYLPFSMGPRGCIGMQFSLVEQKIALVKLFQRFYLQRPQNSPPLQLQSKVFVMPKDHKLKVFLRPEFDTAARDAKPAPTGKRPTLTWQVQPASAGHDTRLRILYGSNGGSTRDLAQKTASKAQELGFKTALTSMDKLPVEELFDEGSCTVILCATYNGQPPDQSVAFLEFVRSSRMRHETPLRGSSFAVFGCGNTQWVTTYQAVPVALDESLEAIGSRRLLKRHEGDSAEDMEKHFELWLDSLWPALASSHGISLERVESTESLPLPVVAIMPEGTTAAPLTLDYEGGAQLLCVAVNRELVDSTGDRSVRHIELDLDSSSTYKAGDHLAVYPENDPVLVTKLMERLDVPEGAVVRLDFKPVYGAGDAQVVTLRDWLLRAVDLSKGSGATAIGYLASRATVELDQLLLDGMAKADYAQRMQMPLLELLMKFPSIKITLTEVLALLPQMKPRLYSISSSPLALSGKVSITVGVLRGTTASGREHLGVSSNFLAARSVGDRVWASVRNTGSSFRLPPISTPLILVGPGTGVAPLRGFLQELQHQRKHGAVTGDVHLFFGCRTKADFLYEDELRALEADGTLTKLHVAFSRVGDEDRYVQHLIQKQGAALWPLLSNGGHIFVCGDAARMAPDVRDAVQLVAAKKGGMGESKAQQFLQELRSESALKRYHEDVWAGNA
jgi:cytochrome P450/NADPH-cytochrome P450 reductase